MKTILSALPLLLFSFSCFSQESKSYDELIKQSRKARTTSIVLVSTGPVLAVGGIGTLIYGIIQKENGYRGYYVDANGNYINLPAKKYTTEIVVGTAAALVGIGVALSSIAFTKKANDLKREAKKMKLKTSTDHISIPGLQNAYANARITQYKLSLVVPLGKK